MYFSQCNLNQNKKRVALAKGRIITRIKCLRPLLIFENFNILDMLIWSIRLPLLRGNDQKLHAITATMVALYKSTLLGKIGHVLIIFDAEEQRKMKEGNSNKR